MWATIESMRSDLPSVVIAIAHCAFGDMLCIACDDENRGRVYLWEHEGREPSEDPWIEFPWLTLSDDYQFKPDDWPGYPD